MEVPGWGFPCLRPYPAQQRNSCCVPGIVSNTLSTTLSWDFTLSSHSQKQPHVRYLRSCGQARLVFLGSCVFVLKKNPVSPSFLGSATALSFSTNLQPLRLTRMGKESNRERDGWYSSLVGQVASECIANPQKSKRKVKSNPNLTKPVHYFSNLFSTFPFFWGLLWLTIIIYNQI